MIRRDNVFRSFSELFLITLSVLVVFNILLNNIAFSQKAEISDQLSMEESTTIKNHKILEQINESNTTILISKILANDLENRLQKAGAILEITANLPQVRNTSSAYLLNQTLTTLYGIPQDADIQKRQIAQDILNIYKDFFEIVFIMPNGDVYLLEPYSIQETLTITNLAFRDYFQGALRTHDTYLGNVITSLGAGMQEASLIAGIREALIAVPIYSQNDNSTLIGVWTGGLDFEVINNDLQSLNLTADNKRVVYTDHNGQKIADSDINSSKKLESFATLNSFKSAINGESGSTIETINDKKMVITYQPVKAFHNTWAVLLMEPYDEDIMT